MENKITIVIADDHPIFLAGLISVINRRTDFEILGQADNGKDVLALLRTKKPNIALLDIQMPVMDGMQVAETIIKEIPGQKIILLTMFNDENLVRRALNCGVMGYVLKDNAVSQITLAIDSVASGGVYISPQLTNVLSNRRQTKVNAKDEMYTVSEKKILNLISEGKSSKAIATLLNVSEKTIENHRGNICKKLGISGSAALLRYAMQNKMEFK